MTEDPAPQPSGAAPTPGRRRAWGAAAGVVAALAGLAVASLAALRGATPPVAAVSEAVIGRVPRWAEQAAIEAFGTRDKAVLAGVVVALLLASAAAAGALAATRRRRGLVVAALIPALALPAVVSRPDATPGDLVPTVLGGAVGVGVLAWLTSAAPPRDARGRRELVRALLVVGVLGALGGGVGTWLAGRRSATEGSRAAVRLGGLGRADPPAGAGLGAPGVGPWRTPAADFFRIDTAVSVPLLTTADWRLRVHGLVAREVDVGFDDLLARGLVDRWGTLTCVSNEVGGTLAGNALWTGVPLGPLLAEAGPQPGADMVLSTSADGWTAGTPLAVLTDGRDALLAVGMNGEPLPVEHGFPVRLVVPGLYGYVSATKWVTDLELTSFDAAQAYWTIRGWAEQAEVLTASRIETPRAGARLAAGAVTVAGTAWAQHRGVAEVHVQVDDGPWQPATIGRVPSADTWCQWRLRWDAPAGTHRLTVRAVDGSGDAQTAAEAPPFPRGATGHHGVTVHVA